LDAEAKEDAMQGRDSDAAGPDAGFSATVRNFHAFAEEVGRVSRTSFAQNAKLMDELGSARDIGDILAIQTKFVTGMSDTFNKQFQSMLSHMAELPAGFAATVENTAAPTARASDAEQKPRAEPVEKRTESDPPPPPFDAGQTESAEAAQQTANSGRDALQELAKVAAELRRAEAEARKDVGADNDAAQNTGSGPRRA
jgi:hypothetical protein